MHLPLEDSSDEALHDLIEALQLEVQYRAIHTNSKYRHDQLEGAGGYLFNASICVYELMHKPKELPKDE